MGRIVLISCILAIIFPVAANLYASPINAFVSIPPQKAFIQAIGQGLVEVEIMIQPGSNPATYEPKPSQLSRLAKTDIYFAVGVPFERAWLDRFQAVNPKMEIVHTDKEIPKRALPARHNLKSGPDQTSTGQNGHTGIKDPHIWLSPPLVKIQARTMCRALEAIDPQNASQYRDNLSAFLQDIEALDRHLHDVLAPVQGQPFVVFHPAWGYFAHTYELQQIAVELEGKDPKPSQLARLISFARQKNIQAIFVQPQFSDKSARVIAREIGAEVISADPLAQDWAENLRRQARALRRALAE
ncbi:MAG: metal ABC transporter solute-binding protein, Zn/Mn family [Desulfovermiculus sp.]